MAIKGAFGAGFVQGFGESMKKNADKRFDQQQRYVDNMMENARRLAPKYMQDKATADSAIDLMNEFQTRYGVTNEEFIALYQTHDVAEVYKMIQAEEAGLRPKERLDVRKNILGALNIPKGTKLPDGMRAEDAVRSMILGYAQNLGSKPDDTSEAHKNNSWAKAVSNVLALNPRASAEEQIAGMQVAGVPVQEILQYQAMQGNKYKPLQGVSRSGVINFDDGYEPGDYDQTVKSYQSAFRFTFAKTDDLATLVEGATQTTEALNRIGAADTSELATKIYQGGISMANLELALANTGVKEVSRDVALRTLSAEVNTAEQFNNMQSAIKSGLAADLIRESLDKHGTLTEEYVNKILQNQPMKQDPVVATGADPVVADPVTLDMTGAPGFRERDDIATQTEAAIPTVDPKIANTSIVGGLLGGAGSSDTAPSVTTAEDPSVTMQNLSALYNPAKDEGMSVEDRIDAKRRATMEIAGDIADTASAVGDKLLAVDKALDVATGNAVLNIRAKANTTLGAIAQIAGKEELADSFYKVAIEAEDGSRKGVRLDQGMYQAINEMFDDMGIFMPSEIAPAEDAVNAFVDAPNTEGRDLDADLGVGYEPATTRLYSTMDRLKKLRLVLEQEEVTPEEIVEAVSKPERAIGTVGFQDLGLREDVRPQEAEEGANVLTRATDTPASKELQAMIDESRSDVAGFNAPGESTTYEIDPEASLRAGESINTVEPADEMLSYEVWKDMTKAERKSVGLDLPLVTIQNRVRSGSIPLPKGKSLPTPLRMKQERYLAASTESGTVPRVPADEAIMTRPTKQDLTSPTRESSISVERSTGPSKALADLRTTFNRIHGKKSKASKQLERVLQEAQSGTPIQYTDVNQLLRITRSLPKTKTRDDLAAKLYDLAQGLR